MDERVSTGRPNLHVISRKKIREFLATHPDCRDAAAPLDRWFRIARTAEWANFREVKASFGSVDEVGDLLVFNIKGNHYRLIADVFYADQVLLIRHVLTHKEYDVDQWKRPPGKSRKETKPKKRK